MWLFTQYGFFSAVCAREGDGSYTNRVDPTRIMVRARLKNHLENLKRRFTESIGDVEIVETPDTDYRYRIFIDKSKWTHVLASLGGELDYDNFKSKVAGNLDDVGSEYENSLHDVWGVMHSLQR
jgi:hypothetical protein|tara:strand:- start:13 stop:384 length:372 start_codon:yes stop_codon:yes gene_type:complete